MSRDGDHDSDERPKLSWREIDQRRDGAHRRDEGERRPRSKEAKERAAAATERYVKQLDETVFAGTGRAGSGAQRLAAAVRDARGTPDLADTCRTYLAELGPPADPHVLGAFLDARERDLVLAALRVLAERGPESEIEVTPGLRAQIRILAGEPDDEVAELAEEILESL